MLKRCGLALAYYAPMPDQREGADLAEGAVGLLKALAGLKVSVDMTIEEETWKLHPPGYFEERFAYSVGDYRNIL